MPITISTKANEESTFALDATFYDEDDLEITPNTVTWTLTDTAGTVINNRTAQSITADTTVTIVLKGDDLALQTGEVGSAKRILTIEAVYDSNIGSNLPLKEAAHFRVVDLKAIT
jgi:hypothetical protein